MAKKILIISASPRKSGNSDLLCDQFTLGAWESGHNVEKIFLRSEKIKYCIGCGNCIETGKCVQKDSMNEILTKMVDADVLVFATPVYFYAMNGQLKTFIDRTVPRYREFKGKIYFIATCADPEQSAVEGTVSDFRGFLACATGLEEAGMIFGLGVWNVGDVVNNPAMLQAYQAGKNS
ncbi:MAG: flavodoxin family protein [Tannerellaceae bacterium]|jgi:multimeric flavodoxin WrbA|nr:flavodoxin family protein [Tannerellaceae bacterium]